jgi:hypothetical protein
MVNAQRIALTLPRPTRILHSPPTTLDELRGGGVQRGDRAPNAESGCETTAARCPMVLPGIGHDRVYGGSTRGPRGTMPQSEPDRPRSEALWRAAARGARTSHPASARRLRGRLSWPHSLGSKRPPAGSLLGRGCIRRVAGRDDHYGTHHAWVPAVELIQDITKPEVDAASSPCGCGSTNSAWRRASVPSDNVLGALESAALPPALSPVRPRRLRFSFFTPEGRLQASFRRHPIRLWKTNASRARPLGPLK